MGGEGAGERTGRRGWAKLEVNAGLVCHQVRAGPSGGESDLAAGAGVHEGTGGVVVVGDEVGESGTALLQVSGEVVEVPACCVHVYGDEPGPSGAEQVDGGRVGGDLDCDVVTGGDEGGGDEVEAVEGTARDQDLLRAGDETSGGVTRSQSGAQRWQPERVVTVVVEPGVQLLAGGDHGIR